MKSQFRTFLLRWLANTGGILLATKLLETVAIANNSMVSLLLAGLVLSLVNSVLRPLVLVLSLPAILFSLGLFIIMVNGAMVYVASKLVGQFVVDDFGSAIITGIIIGIVNYVITALTQEKRII